MGRQNSNTPTFSYKKAGKFTGNQVYTVGDAGSTHKFNCDRHYTMYIFSKPYYSP